MLILTEAQTKAHNKKQHERRASALKSYAVRKGTAQERRDAKRSKRGVIFTAKAVA